MDKKTQKRIDVSIAVPGDKSISHRSAMLAALAEGDSVVTSYSPGRDCAATLDCLRALGVQIDRGPAGIVVHGVGLHGLREPADVLDCRNSGTTMRLLSGILAGQDFMSVVTGDSSLRSRPMNRVAAPLRLMGATVDGREGGRKAPLYIRGPGGGSPTPLRPLDHYVLPVASAQVKSCIMLAAMFADGETTVVENLPTRDHTERMMRLFGGAVKTGNGQVTVTGSPALRATRVDVPGDISSAAFWLAAGAIAPGSRVEVRGVGLNPLRCGFLNALRSMGCRIEIRRQSDSWEPVGDVCVYGDGLRAIELSGPDIPAVVDEIPILAVCAAAADGRTVITGAGELRHKETDRISAVVENLRAMGASAGEFDDGFWVEGGRRLHGALIRTRGDHRIAMAFAIAGLIADGEVVLDDPGCIDVSYPGFLDQLRRVAEGLEAEGSPC